MERDTEIMEAVAMNNRERGWPDDCRKCDLYDREKQDCGMRSGDSGTPVCECMSRKRYEYLTRED